MKWIAAITLAAWLLSAFAVTSSPTTIDFYDLATGTDGVISNGYAGLNRNSFSALVTSCCPPTLPLFAGGLGLLGWMARRRRKGEQLA